MQLASSVLSLPRQPISPPSPNVASQSPPEATVAEADLQGWADRVTGAYKKSVHAIVAVGRLLIEAKAAVPHGDWARLFKEQAQAVARPVPISQHTAEQFMRIARHPTLSNSSHGSNLPTSWRTLAELARLEPETLEAALALGRIHPEITREEVHVFFFRWRSPRDSGNAKKACIESLDAIRTLLMAQEALRNWATEVSKELATPLRLSEDGRILSGVWWVPPFLDTVAERSPKVAHQCQCPACGHTHRDRRD